MLKAIFLSFALLTFSFAGVVEPKSGQSHYLQLTLGDSSSDGHNKVAVFTIKSNLTKKEISLAYKEGSKILNFDFSNKIAIDFEDSTLSKIYLKKLRAAGLKTKISDEEEYEQEDYILLDCHSFLEIWLFIVQLGNPQFQFEINQPEKNLNIGGYGLF